PSLPPSLPPPLFWRFDTVHSSDTESGDCARVRGSAAAAPDSSRSLGLTESGHRCLKWSKIPDFIHRFPHRGLGAHSLCRNPDGRLKPWCFYRNHRGRIDWAYCGCKQGLVLSTQRVWGMIFSTNWEDRDTSVVCWQLGTEYILKYNLIIVHWSNVQCQGHEHSLLECVKKSCHPGNYLPKQAATVTCNETSLFVPIRLAGGNSEYEGRVEVYRAGQWGTICDDHWDEADAEVICRQLGISGPAKAQTLAYFGEGSGPIFLDDVQCTGNELSIDQCAKSLWGEHNCGHKEDASVSCNPLRDGTLRLTGGEGSHEGQLEVYFGGHWGSVCDDGWTEQNSHVVCRQLGFRYKTEVIEECQFGRGTGPIHLDDVNCSGQELSLSSCSRSEWGKHDCSHQEDVAIVCTHSPPIRLMDGENKKEGRVEIFINGQWGTICDDGWTDKDATVVCRQLSYKGSAKARSLAYFGDGVGPIHMDNVKCTGTELMLADCIKQDIGTHNCRHSEDAGVICDYKSVPSLCGLRLLNQRQKRIIGGKNSLRGGWPWQAAIRLRASHRDGRLLCGATLISSCWVLTAAHCFKRYGNNTKNYVVRLGDYHTLVPEEYEEDVEVKSIIIHKDYKPDANDYDIALVKLEGQLNRCAKFNAHVLPACLPHRRERAKKVASNCYITGWGDTGRAYSKTLQQAAIPLLPKRLCEDRYKNRFTGRMLCAGNLLDHKRVDSCQGDSGGPLMCERPGGHWVVFGVTSWGHGCGVKDTPGVYTRVSAFVPWIKRVTKL
uniref:Neurotrypsin n=1 Tax=Callorhinchus milii TaxID=7868 RepID=A0A4W3GVC7_CALMI